MFFIIGGAYQGKLDYARTRFALQQEDIFTCTGGEIDFSRRCVCRIDTFVRACAENGADPVEYFRKRKELWKDSVLICRDVSCGVVPVEAELRHSRQETGRLCQYLSMEAERVVRIFCGLEQILK